jgi:hypothetical protein
MNPNKVYSVTPGTHGKLHVIDATTGRVLNNIIYTGTIVSGPIVVGDKCTLVTQNQFNIKKGHIYRLPQGTLHQTYSV